jgi:hypothetical protein
MPLSNWNFVVNCSILTEYPIVWARANPTAITGCPNYQLASRHKSQSQIPLQVYQNDSIGRNSNLETSHRPNSTFWKTKPNCSRQFKSVHPKLTINERFLLLPTGTKTRGIMSRKSQCLKVSVFTKEHRAANLHPTWQLMGVQPKLMHLIALAALIASPCVP